MAQEEEPAFRPTLPLEQAAFKGSTAEEQKRLENEFAFMFEKTWVVNGRVRAGDTVLTTGLLQAKPGMPVKIIKSTKKSLVQ